MFEFVIDIYKYLVANLTVPVTEFMELTNFNPFFTKMIFAAGFLLSVSFLINKLFKTDISYTFTIFLVFLGQFFGSFEKDFAEPGVVASSISGIIMFLTVGWGVTTIYTAIFEEPSEDDDEDDSGFDIIDAWLIWPMFSKH